MPLPYVEAPVTRCTGAALPVSLRCLQPQHALRYTLTCPPLMLTAATPPATGPHGSIAAETVFVPEGQTCPTFLRPSRLAWASAPVLRKLSGLENVSSLDVVAELRLPPAASFGSDGAAGAAASLAAAGVAAAAGGGVAKVAIAGTAGDAAAGAGGRAAGVANNTAGSGAISAAAAGAARPPRLRRLLALEGVQDPGNLGTLLRSAAAFGWDACFLLPGEQHSCCLVVSSLPLHCIEVLCWL